jgi:murein DD-endopeptidase MepM/ murein hydrolase activator NlpD
LKRLFKRTFLIFLLCSILYAVFMLFVLVKERKYVSPVTNIIIRNDSYGDGHFGASRSNGKRKHKGVDLKAKVGEPVVAVKSGWAWTEVQPTGYGNIVKINHLDGRQSRYAHLDKFDIWRFQWVCQGDKIGEIGKTGNANYKRMVTHLHFEIRKPDKQTCVDPMKYIVKDL